MVLMAAGYYISVNSDVIVYGIVFSLFSSSVIAFNVRKSEEYVFFSDKDKFVRDFIESLTKMGYIEKEYTTELLELEPTVYSSLFAGNIQLYLTENSATIEGARFLLRKVLAEIPYCKESFYDRIQTEECVFTLKKQ
jgi:hypothetical protein